MKNTTLKERLVTAAKDQHLEQGNGVETLLLEAANRITDLTGALKNLTEQVKKSDAQVSVEIAEKALQEPDEW